jgi:hypothetical protein
MTFTFYHMSDLLQDDIWIYEFDDAFPSDDIAPQPIEPCTRCKPLLSPGHSVKVLDLEDNVKACPFCLTLLKAMAPGTSDSATLIGSVIILQPSGTAILRVYSRKSFLRRLSCCFSN